jgi:hypothetical protein
VLLGLFFRQSNMDSGILDERGGKKLVQTGANHCKRLQTTATPPSFFGLNYFELV